MDSAYRAAAATLALGRSEPGEALRLLDPDVPVDPPRLARDVDVLRVEAIDRHQGREAALEV